MPKSTPPKDAAATLEVNVPAISLLLKEAFIPAETYPLNPPIAAVVAPIAEAGTNAATAAIPPETAAPIRPLQRTSQPDPPDAAVFTAETVPPIIAEIPIPIPITAAVVKTKVPDAYYCEKCNIVTGVFKVEEY